jgi:putative chitinase
MLLRHIITEAGAAPLYHSTAIENVPSILQSKMLEPSDRNYVSLTRDPNYDFASDPDTPAVTFVIDTNLLKQHHKIEPFDFNGSDEDDHEAWAKNPESRRHESEERVPGSIPLSVVKEIWLPITWKKYQDHFEIKDILDRLLFLRIPYKFITTPMPWNTGNNRKVTKSNFLARRTEPEVAEGWREKVAGAATAATVAYGAMHGAHTLQQSPATSPQAITAPATAPLPAELNFKDKNPVRDILVAKAKAAGIKGMELAHLISQVAHETGNFKNLEEIGTPKYFAKNYDKKYNPNKAKQLGNVKVGDGERYKGRGFVHITGRYNYKKAGEALGLPLESQPELAADPKIAADIAIWYWKSRVQPKVGNFPDATVAQVTKPINPGLKGLDSRQSHFMKIANR